MNGRRSIRENAPFSLCPPEPAPPAYLYRLRASARANSPTRKAARGGSCGEAEAEPPRPALAYLILPIDFIKAKDTPLLGWLDEAISIGVLIQKMSNRITPEIEARADVQLDRWFAPNLSLR